MSDHANELEMQALALLDARGRHAAASLKTVLAQRTPEAPASPTEVPAPLFYLNDRITPSRTAHRNGWLAAAVVLVVVGLVAAFLALRGEPSANVVSEAEVEGAHLVPGWLPDGWEAQTAASTNTADDPEAVSGEIAVYGEWAGPRVSVTRARGMDASNTEDAEQITVADHPATLESGGDTVAVQWTDADGIYWSVAGAGMSREAVVAAAQHVLAAPAGRATDETLDQLNDMGLGDEAAVAAAVAVAEGAGGGPVVVAAGLPDGFAEIARGPLTATTLMISVGFDGLSLVYGDPASSSLGQLAIIQRSGDADDAALMRLASEEVEVVEVRGQPGYLQPGTLLQWFEESSGMVVTLYGGGLDTETLLRVANGLRPADPGEIAGLLRRHGQSGPFADDLEEGEVIVTEGDNNGEHWRLKASDDGDTWMLLLDTPTSGEGVGESKDVDPSVTDVNQADATVGGDQAIFGTVDPRVAELVIRLGDGTEIPVELHDVDIEGWPTKVFVGFLPADSVFQVIARDGSGTVLANEDFDTGFEEDARSSTASTVIVGGELQLGGG